jgi:YrbI family 3-deoxy-D-manno-octulosonate 8-phosphate phosphatase
MDLPKLVITDIDGVWTDGGMYYDASGHEQKKFNPSDSAGVLFLNRLRIPLAIMTGENSDIVLHRARKLRIERVYLGVSDKLTVAQSLCSELGIALRDVAFIGDDLNDMSLLRKVGISGCPCSASSYVQSLVDIVVRRVGGAGAFREFVETILHQSGRLQDVIEACATPCPTTSSLEDEIPQA